MKVCKEEIKTIDEFIIEKVNKCLVAHTETAVDKNKLKTRISNDVKLRFSSRSNNIEHKNSVKRKKVAFLNIKKLVNQVAEIDLKAELLFVVVDEIPVFDDCIAVDKELDGIKCFNSNLENHFKENFIYPEKAIAKKAEGRVFLKFVINKYGQVDRVETFSSGNKSVLEAEVKRIVLLFPDFLPGKENGHNVGVVYTMPIDFKL